MAWLPAGLGRARPFDPAWCLVADTDEDMAMVESLFCLADGMIGTRAVLEQGSRADGAPVTVAGIYEPAPDVGERLMTLPSWVDLPLMADIPPGRRVLDLRDGLLIREVRLEDATLRTVRFAAAGLPGTAVLVAEFSPSLLAGGPLTDAPAELSLQQRSVFGGGVALSTNTTLGGGTNELLLVERIASYATSSRRPPSSRDAMGKLRRSQQLGAAGLLARQRSLWDERWAGADVEAVGDIESTRSLRASLFHLRSTVSRRGEAAIAARGLSGPAYAGHVFWDCEAFVVPALAAFDPAAARAALEYRIRRLEPARRRADRDGRSGARFPWESAHSGADVTPKFGINQRGEKVPIDTGATEEHVTAAVAWAAWQFATWQGSWSFLHGPGRPLVIETARYWASRIRHDSSDGSAHIDGVIGPDEYHERVDDNTFTNLMARWNLRRAAELVERLGDDADEAAGWRRIADDLVDNYCVETGRYEQFAGYDGLEPLMASAAGTPPVAADLVLGAERIQETQIIKQADVLMAHFLIPDGVADGSLAPNLDHYLPRTAHGSSLSPAVHAALLARVGRVDQALDLFRIAAAIDFGDLTGSTAGGLHLANLGGMWQAVVRGFAGLSVSGPSDRSLTLAPVLPEPWRELRFRLQWRKVRVSVTCLRDAVHIACDRPLTVNVHGTATRVEPPGRWLG
jgi:trehalose/maltose hydrolase-like predicted phosphorylase